MQWFAGMVRRPAARRRGSRPHSGSRRPNSHLVLEALESRWCPALTLTDYGVAEGLSLSTFATNVPTQGGSTGTIGAYSLAFPGDGTVLGSDEPGNVRVYPGDFDGQNALEAPVRQNYGNANAKGLAQLGDTIYMVGYFTGTVIQINTDGTFNRVIASGLPTAEDVVADPNSGHLYVSTQQYGLWDVDPNTGEKSLIAPGGFFGISLSADGTTLYAGTVSGPVFGFDTTTYAQVFSVSPMWPGQAVSVAQGTGAFAGNLYVNTYSSGQVWEVNITDPTQQQLIADGGPPTGGAFITVDPTDGSLLIGEADRIERISFPTDGGGGVAGGVAASPAPLGHQQLAVALAAADSPLSHSPANGLPPPHPEGDRIPSPREQDAPAGLTAAPQPGFAARNALDAFFTARQKDNYPMGAEDRDLFASGQHSPKRPVGEQVS
jgi:hypothetical protein